MMSPGPYDDRAGSTNQKRIGVIGAGMAGLIASTQLAKQGHRVYLVDRAKYPGGSAGYYVRKGVEYPTGATIAFGMEPGGPLRALLEDVGVHVDTFPTPHCMDVVLPDRVVHVYTDGRTWEQELMRAFPERAADVVDFWGGLHRIADAVYKVSKSFVALPIVRPSDVGRLPGAVLKKPAPFLRMLPQMSWTVEEALKRYDLADYGPFRRFLDAQLIDAAQVDVSSAAWIPATVALDIYRYGVFDVPGGLTTIVKALLEKAHALDVEVLLSQTVLSAAYDKTLKVWRVKTNRMTIEVDEVINASGRPIAMDSVDGSSHFDDIHEGQGLHLPPVASLSEAVPEWGAIRVDALVPTPWLTALNLPIDVRRHPFAFQLATDAEIGALVDDPHGAIYITIHPASSGEYPVVTASIHTPAKDWLNLSKAAYQAQKALVAEALMGRMEKVLPGFQANAISSRVGTPVTYERYINKPVVGGTPLTVGASIRKPIGSRTRLPGWYLAGDAVFPGPGTLSSALSGLFAARAIDASVGRSLPRLC